MGKPIREWRHAMWKDVIYLIQLESSSKKERWMEDGD